MTISAVWSGVLSWLKKWRLTRWEFDPRTIEMRRRIDGIRGEADQLVGRLHNESFWRDQFERTATNQLVEIQSLKDNVDLLMVRLDTEREAHAKSLAAVRQRYDGRPDIDTYKKSLDELREKYGEAVVDRNKWRAYGESRDESIRELNRENATLLEKYELALGALTPAPFLKLQLAREENKRLRAKLAAITDRNGAIFDHPEYRKVARRLRAAREKLHVVGRVLRLSLETERTREIGKPFPMKCEFDFSVSATSSPKVAYVQEREYATAPNRSINTDILDTICGVTQVPQSERGPLVNGC